MIDPFEAALADLLADRLVGVPIVAAVTRPRDGLSAPPGDACRVSATVVDGATTAELGGDRPERLDRTTERTTLRLAGRIRLDVEIGSAAGPAAAGQRTALWEAADAVLVALADPEVRSGRVWGEAHEQGFAIDRLAFERITEPLPPDPRDHRRLELWCSYEGRFWPVVALAEGGVIEEPIRTRVVVGDLDLPDGLVVTSGGADLIVPVRVDLRATGLAEPRLAARLLGASPPGSLIGDAEGVPAGFVGYLPDADDRFQVRFRPAPAPSAGPATVVLALASADAPTVTVGRLDIEVIS